MMLDSAVAEVIGDAPVELPDGETVLTGELAVGFAMLNNGWLLAVVVVADGVSVSTQAPQVFRVLLEHWRWHSELGLDRVVGNA